MTRATKRKGPLKHSRQRRPCKDGCQLEVLGRGGGYRVVNAHDWPATKEILDWTDYCCVTCGQTVRLVTSNMR